MSIEKEYIKYAKICAMSYKGKYGNYELPFIPMWYKDKNTDWFIGEDENNLYIVIQGSRSNKDKKGLISQDWLDNFKFRKKMIKIKVNGRKVKVHRGHHKQVLRILKHVDTTTKMCITKKQIIVMGHSAGGSIASILGLVLKNYSSLWESYFVFTEGQNKSMNKAGAEYFDKNVNSLRIVNANDPVPCVPFKMFGYRHTKNVINIGKKRKWWHVIVLFGRWKKNMVDHSPQDYVENLEKYYAEKDN